MFCIRLCAIIDYNDIHMSFALISIEYLALNIFINFVLE